jgi:ketosteroid isomerase-like protein
MSRQQEIDEFDDGFCKAFANQDPVALASFYTEDAKLLPPNAPLVEGRKGVEGFAADMFAAGAQALELDTVDVIEGGDLAVGTGKYTMTIQPPGGDPIQDVGKYIAVYQRQADGGLKLVRDTFNGDAPAA